MIKHDVIDSPKSCFNTAYDQEHLFVLLARDPAAPVAIRAWIAERLRLGRNQPGDEQIREAYECATLMELQRGEISSTRSQQQPSWMNTSIDFLISTLTTPTDLHPRCWTLSWQDLTMLLSEPTQTSCTRQTCRRESCPHKQGPCWSPAAFGDTRREVKALGLLVFDIDRRTDNQIDSLRNRLKGLQYLMHSTHSDLPDSRCLRIVIPLSEPVPAALWKPFFHAAQQRLVPIADPAACDAQRVYFLPSCPQDATYFLQVHEGNPLDVKTLLKTILSPQVADAAPSEVKNETAP